MPACRVGIPPDGYTVLALGDSVMLLGVQKRLPFDVLKALDSVVPDVRSIVVPR